MTTASCPSIPWRRASTRSARSPRGGVATPEAELATGRRDDLVGHEPHQHEASRRLVDRLIRHPSIAASRARARMPTTLRAASGHGSTSAAGVSAPLVAPAPAEPLAVLGLGLDHHLGARQPELLEAAEQPVGETLRRERGFVDAGRGRVELARLDQIGRRRHGRPRRASSCPDASRWACAPSGPNRVSTAPAREPGEGAEGVQAEPDEQVREARPPPSNVGISVGDGPGSARNAGDSPGPRRTAPRRRIPVRIRVGAPCREPRRERAVGDPDARAGHPGGGRGLRAPAPRARRRRRSTATVPGSGT